MRTKTNLIITIATIMLLQLGFAGGSNAQLPDLSSGAIKPGPKFVPKVVLMGATSATKGTTQYHDIILQVTNRDVINGNLFTLPGFAGLPPNPCKKSRTRIVLGIYTDWGVALDSCRSIGAPEQLREVPLLIEKGKPIPRFVYLVLTDLKTGTQYKSNYVSPSDGTTK
ncbi:MAG TPA: hypothetical protein VMZ26_16005 [Pyrinomonadaceae bacterium]|nr:hypothetical protein [Pyrinomonadaceae bacterium]